MTKKKAVINWSGGKDSAHALYRVLQQEEYEVVALLTTINRVTQLSTMHNIPISLLKAQSKSIGIPLDIIELTPKGDINDYTTTMSHVAKRYKSQGVKYFIYGDIHLQDIRKYREQQMHPLGIEVVEPLWEMSTQKAIEAYLDSGLKTIIVTTEAEGLGMKAIGQHIDKEFISLLPPETDPNGENGEYHTFCYDGPIYQYPIAFDIGCAEMKSYDITLEDGSVRTFTYCFAKLRSIPQ